MFHPRNDRLLPLARQLRKEMTKEERILWFEYLRTYPVRFRRQEIIGNYIADFFCSKAGLVIELDGSQHYEEEQKHKDAIRTERLKEYDLTVIRIPNNEIHSNLRGVCEYINMVVQNALKERGNDL